MAEAEGAPSSIYPARRALARADVDAALAAIEPLLTDDPDNVDALYVRAVTQRYRQDFRAARQALDALLAIAPGYARARQEEGHLYRAMGDQPAALRSFEQAVRINPRLMASVRARVELLTALGRRNEALQAKAQLDYLAALPKPLLAVMDLIGEGRLLKAEDLCRRFLRQAPRHVEGMRLLADIGIRLGVLDDAEFLLERACAFEPDNNPAHIDYIAALRKRQQYAAALDQARPRLHRTP